MLLQFSFPFVPGAPLGSSDYEISKDLIRSWVAFATNPYVPHYTVLIFNSTIFIMIIVSEICFYRFGVAQNCHFKITHGHLMIESNLN